jgi:hypothetical protein
VVLGPIPGDFGLADKQPFVLVPFHNLGTSASNGVRHAFLEGRDVVWASCDDEREGCSIFAGSLQRVGLFAASDEDECRESGTCKEPHCPDTLGASLTVRILPSSQRKNTRMWLPKIEPQSSRASRERLVRHDDLQLGAGRTDRA